MTIGELLKKVFLSDKLSMDTEVDDVVSESGTTTSESASIAQDNKGNDGTSKEGSGSTVVKTGEVGFDSSQIATLKADIIKELQLSNVRTASVDKPAETMESILVNEFWNKESNSRKE